MSLLDFQTNLIKFTQKKTELMGLQQQLLDDIAFKTTCSVCKNTTSSQYTEEMNPLNSHDNNNLVTCQNKGQSGRHNGLFVLQGAANDDNKLKIDGKPCTNDNGDSISCDAGRCVDIISGANTNYDKAFKINRIKSTCGTEEENQYIYNNLSHDEGVANVTCCSSLESDKKYWMPTNYINNHSYNAAIPGIITQSDYDKCNSLNLTQRFSKIEEKTSDLKKIYSKLENYVGIRKGTEPDDILNDEKFIKIYNEMMTENDKLKVIIDEDNKLEANEHINLSGIENNRYYIKILLLIILLVVLIVLYLFKDFFISEIENVRVKFVFTNSIK